MAFDRFPYTLPCGGKKNNRPDIRGKLFPKSAEIQIAFMSAQYDGLNVGTECVQSCKGSVGYSRNRVVIEGNSFVRSHRLQPVRERLKRLNGFTNGGGFNTAERYCRNCGDDVLHIEPARKHDFACTHDFFFTVGPGKHDGFVTNVAPGTDPFFGAEWPQSSFCPLRNGGRNRVIHIENEEILACLKSRDVLFCGDIRVKVRVVIQMFWNNI